MYIQIYIHTYHSCIKFGDQKKLMQAKINFGGVIWCCMKSPPTPPKTNGWSPKMEVWFVYNSFSCRALEALRTGDIIGVFTNYIWVAYIVPCKKLEDVVRGSFEANACPNHLFKRFSPRFNCSRLFRHDLMK